MNASMRKMRIENQPALEYNERKPRNGVRRLSAPNGQKALGWFSAAGTDLQPVGLNG